MKKTAKQNIILVLAIVVGIVMVLGATYGIMTLVERRSHANSEKLVSEVVTHIDNKMNEVKVATEEESKIATERLNDPEALEELVRDFVEKNEFIYGSTIAFEPNYFPEYGKSFAPYSWRTQGDVINSRQLGTETNYYQEEWYLETKKLGHEYWCEPYFDEGGAKVMMCTFSIPLFNSEGRLVAVMTADVGLDDLEEYVASIAPSEDSYIALFSKKGTPLVNSGRDATIGKGTVIIKGLTENNWNVELVMPLNYLLHGDKGTFIFVAIVFLFAIFLAILVSRLLDKQRERAASESTKIMNAFSEDFIAVEYVELNENKNDDTIVKFRDSKELDGVIPTWTTEQSFVKRVVLFRDYFVYEPDRKDFYQSIKREKVIEELEKSDIYFINFRGVLNNEIKYYQIQFSAVKENDRIKGVVMGFRSVDEQMKAEFEQDRQIKQSLTFTNYFLSTYVSAYYVNLETGACQIYKRTEQIEEEFPIIGDYYESLKEYFYKYVHPDDRDVLLSVTKPERIKEILSGTNEYHHIYRDNLMGEYRQFRLQIIRGADDDHAAFGFIDITEELEEQQKRILGAVALSNDVLQKANVGLWAFELDEGSAPRMYVDDTMLGLVGLEHQVSPEETYHAWYDHIDENSYDIVTDAVAKMSAGEHAEVQYPWHHPDGHTMIVRCGGIRNFEYKAGIRIEGTHQDVTATLHFDDEQRRKEAEDLSLMLVSSLSEDYATLYYVNAESGEYQLITKDNEFGNKVNTRLSKGNGFYKDSADSMNEVVCEEDHEKMWPFYSKENMETAFGDESSFSVDYRLMIDGDLLWYRVKSVKIQGPNGNDYYAVGIRSIEDELKQQKILEEALSAAESANNAKTSFLFNMSHDIRTPMNAIIGFTDRAIRHKEDEKVLNESLEKVKNSSEYLLRIINDILDMAKIESGKLEINEEIYFAEKGKNTLIEVLGAEAAKKGIMLKTSYDIDDKYLWLDKNRIDQIMANLISNSIKYTHSGGEINYKVKQVSCDREGYARIVTTIKDTGVGMTPEFLEKIFESFERSESAIKSGEQGTGLGMAIVKKLVDAIGGTIDIQSKPEKGTMVTLVTENRIATPEEIEALDKALEATGEKIQVDLSGKRVLVVEDNDLNREIVVDLLEEQGIIVDTAIDGDIAVDMVKELTDKEIYDYYIAILMDIQMPTMNGYEATRLIRAIPAPEGVHIPIIAMTANAFEEDKKNAFEAGMDDHIAKPLDVNKLFETLAKHL